MSRYQERDRDAQDHPVLSVIGPEGHGKTDFWTTASRPILCLNIDRNTSAVLKKKGLLDDPDIEVVHIQYPLTGFDVEEDDREDIKNDALDSWDDLMRALKPVVYRKAKPMPRTVVIDTGTELNDLNILAGFGKTSKISPKERKYFMGEVNARFKGLFRGLDHAGVQVVVTHRCKEKWETQEVRGQRGIEEKDVIVPGEYERIGFKQMGNMCNLEVLVMFDPSREGKLSDKFGIRVMRSTIRPGIIGKEWWGKTEDGYRKASFPYLMTQVYKGTTIEEWE